MSTTTRPRKAPAPLPDPAARPQADVVIFDGHCSFCRGQVGWLARLDRGGRLAFLSLHDPAVARQYPDLHHDSLMQEMYVVDRSGRRHRGAEALRYLSRRVPQLWWLAPLLHIPLSLPVWHWCYRQFARRRYLFGRTTCDDDACATHFN